nr:MAG TPA: hypothetical protein [Bacteriophage sp.]
MKWILIKSMRTVTAFIKVIKSYQLLLILIIVPE